MSQNDDAHKILLETIEYLYARVAVLEDVIQQIGVPYPLLIHKFDQQLAKIKNTPDEVRDFIFKGDPDED